MSDCNFKEYEFLHVFLYTDWHKITYHSCDHGKLGDSWYVSWRKFNVIGEEHKINPCDPQYGKCE